jgi:ParB family chromosome partitioning protein
VSTPPNAAGARRGLGRGLAALIPDSTFDSPSERARPNLRVVPLDEVRPNPVQPREIFDPAELKGLADSIRQHGVLSPLVVRRHEGHYVLIAGERRLRAAALAGLSEVPVLVREADEAGLQLELALVENLQRTDLDAIEAARGYQRLIDEFGFTQDEVALRVGKERPTVANALRLLRLPEFVLVALREGRIAAGHARALLSLVDVDDMRRVLAKILAQQLSVRATERLVAALTRTDPILRSTERQRREHTYEYATKLLSETLHTSVAIKSRTDGSGRIVIDYADAEDLDRLIQKLRSEG